MNDVANDVDDSLGELLALQRTAFLREGPPSLAQRRADLKKLRTAIVARKTDITDAMMADFGHRAPFESLMEPLSLVLGIDYLLGNLAKFMRPTRRHVAMSMRFGSARIEYQPLGVIGIVSPWNYPFALAMMPLVTAIAAGNRVMIKPSELTPASADFLVSFLADLFPKEQVAVVTGDASVGAAFSSLPFDHLIFTGSTTVGRAVMKAASENLVPVTLELGGKNPALVEKGSSLQRAAEGIAYGKLQNGGQICISPDYAMVHEDDVAQFVDAYSQAVAAFYPDGSTGTDYTSIINEKHYARLTGLLDDARAKGARVVSVGRDRENAPTRAHTLSPSVVLDTTDDMTIMREEIFGPILPILPYRKVEEAISYINARPRPLALYYFGTRNGGDCRTVLSRTTSGNVTINNTLMHYVQDDLPFGGVGASGMGSYHGLEGFRTFSHAKGVFDQKKWNAGNLLRPPFGGLANFVMKMMLR
ncbi:MAG TPA: coniferyl aldehyde dehydrogenase [Rhizorhapis sp.]